MTDHGYEIRLAWSREDALYIAEVPELPGAVAHGATYEEALANAHEVVRLWIEVAEATGRSVPQPRSAAAQ